jgi:hypothetical protein
VSADFISLADLLRAAAQPPAPAPEYDEERDEGNVQDIVAESEPSSATGTNARIAREAQPVSPTNARDERMALVPAARNDRARLTTCVVPSDPDDAVAGALRDARLFRARLADALDDAVARLVREIATDVLARELRLAPCEIAVLVRRVLERAPVVRVRVAPADLTLVPGVPVLADPDLSAGDAVLELGRGELDARLGVRLAAVLEAFS